MNSKIREYFRSLRREDTHVMLIVSLAIAIVVGLAGSFRADASTLAQGNDLPSAQTISTLPATDELPSSYSISDQETRPGLRAGFDDDDFGDDELGVEDDEAPVTDALALLSVLACLYGILCRRRCRTNTDK